LNDWRLLVSSSTFITKNLTESESSHSRVKSYPFHKRYPHFQLDEIPYSLNDEANHHVVMQIKKSPKSQSSNARHENVWFKISNRTILPAYQSRLNRISVLAGELFRFLDGNLPKYRIYTDKNNEEFLIVKVVPRAATFYDDCEVFWRHGILNSMDSMEGMGRSFFGKFFYIDSDFHDENALVDQEKYFYGIDPDRCFHPVTRQMHVNRCGEIDDAFSTSNYDCLPIVVGNLGNWPWNLPYKWVAPYMKQVAKKPTFCNEKHLSALKILITQDYQKSLVEYHIEHAEDKKAILELLERKFNDAARALAASQAFVIYVRENRVAVLQVIVFESWYFFQENKHYVSASPEEAKKEWEAHASQLIESCSLLWPKLAGVELCVDEKIKLKQFSFEINSLERKSFTAVKDFYLSQGMRRFAGLVDRVMSSKKYDAG